MFIFTSCTNNYIPKARVLASTLKDFHPDWVFCLLLGEEPPQGFALENEPFDRLMTFDQLPIPAYPSWLFRHRVVEICTAAKGPALNYFLENEGHDKVIYLDPDIMVCGSLSPLEALLDRADVLLTPHQLAPQKTDQSIRDNEIIALQYGVFNLGFVAVARRGDGVEFARWWRDRLLSYCYDDIPNGLFTDQRWCNLAPALFDNVHVVRDPGCNAASWNLTDRTITRAVDGSFLANGKPLRFYHFTGYDSGAGDRSTAHYAKGMPAVHELWALYREKLAACGQSVLGTSRWKHASFNGGVPITDAMRLLYRQREDLQKAFPNPFVRPGFFEWYINEQLPRQDAKPRRGQSKFSAMVNRTQQLLDRHGGFPAGIPGAARQTALWFKKWGVAGVARKIWRSDLETVAPERLLPLGLLLGAPESAPAKRLFRMLDPIHEPVCIFEHDWGGGADAYCQKRVDALLAQNRVVLRVRCARETKRLEISVCFGKERLRYELSGLDDLLDAHFSCITRVIVNELGGWYHLYSDLAGPHSLVDGIERTKDAVRAVVRIARHHGAALEFLFHDYFALCPSIYLMTSEHRYCGLPDADDRCDACALRGRTFSMAAWRTVWGELLDAADEVVFFSENTRDTVRNVYPLRDEQVRLRPHDVEPFGISLRIPQAGPMRVAVIGLIQEHKGADVVLDLAAILEKRMPEASIVVFGQVEADKLPENITALGRYQREELPWLLAQHGATVGLFPSVWPETFSYVVHEMGSLGLPLVCFDLGAQAAFARLLPNSRVAGELSAESAFHALLELDRVRTAAS